MAKLCSNFLLVEAFKTNTVVLSKGIDPFKYFSRC